MLPIKETNSGIELLRECSEKNQPLGTKNLNQSRTKNHPPKKEKIKPKIRKKENQNKWKEIPPHLDGVILEWEKWKNK